MKELTEKQNKVFQFIKLQIASNSYPPTIREICDYFKFKSTNGAYQYLTALIKKGFIERGRGARTIKILKEN